LHLEENYLSCLPETFGQLTQLQHLRLSQNQLSSLPETFGELTQLQNLFLHRNQLGDCQVGMQVRFTAYFDSQGRLQGKDLKSGLKVPGLPDATPVKSWTPGFGGVQTITPKDTSGGELGQFLGTITKTGPKFGFIEAPDLTSVGQSSNVFILADELRQYQVGHKVKFTAYLDGKGRLQGKDLKSGLK